MQEPPVITNEKLLLEIYGEVKTVSNDIKYINKNLDRHSAEVKALHCRVDNHSKVLSYFMGSIAIIVVGLKLFGIKIKQMFFGT